MRPPDALSRVLLACCLVWPGSSKLLGSERPLRGSRGALVINLESSRHTRNEGGMVIEDNSFSPNELDEVVRRYARANNIGFDFGGSRATFLIPRSTNWLACVWYASEKGRQALLCKLNFDGKVAQIGVGTASRSRSELPDIVFGTGEATVDSGIEESMAGLVTSEYIESLVRNYVVTNKVDFDLADLRFRGVMVPRARDYLASLSWGHGFGKPALDCKVGFDGRVVEISVAVVRD
jgi:hypothetical protein